MIVMMMMMGSIVFLVIHVIDFGASVVLASCTDTAIFRKLETKRQIFLNWNSLLYGCLRPPRLF